MQQKKCRTCEELLLEFKDKNKIDNSSKINFVLADNDSRDVYNITAPFQMQNHFYIAGRVETRDSENAEVIFFKQNGSTWQAVEGCQPIYLQDPFITFINDMLVLGGVEVYDDPLKPGTLAYRTIFMRGKSLDQLERFAKGPERMKDIRLLELAKDKILVFTRPQGEIGGRGTIGYTVLNSLEELTPERLESAELLKGQFCSEEWGGANQLHILKNGKIGVLSHIAKFDEQNNRHYYSTVFCIDIKTGDYTPMKMIAVRNNFQKGESKRPDLEDVIFSGGLLRKENGQAELYCGAGDAEGHRITIKDPFLEYE